MSRDTNFVKINRWLAGATLPLDRVIAAAGGLLVSPVAPARRRHLSSHRLPASTSKPDRTSYVCECVCVGVHGRSSMYLPTLPTYRTGFPAETGGQGDRGDIHVTPYSPAQFWLSVFHGCFARAGILVRFFSF